MDIFAPYLLPFTIPLAAVVIMLVLQLLLMLVAGVGFDFDADHDIDAMTLEDFGPPLDEEDKEILRNSPIAAHHNLASDDPAIRLQACKDSLARLCS